MTGLLVFSLVVFGIAVLVGIGIVIGANRKPSDHSRRERGHIPPRPAPPSPKKLHTGKLAGIELTSLPALRCGLPPVWCEPPPMPTCKPARVVKRRIHIRRNWIIDKWQVIVRRNGTTIFRSFGTLPETFACAKWWHEHWEDRVNPAVKVAHPDGQRGVR